MRPSIYWLHLPEGGRLAIMPRPRAGDWLVGEIAGWKAEGINLVVDLLEPQEIIELELQQEETVCRGMDIDFVSFPIPDRGVPVSIKDTEQLVHNVSALVTSGKPVAVHCRAGIGRSSLIAACVLVRNGFTANGAFDIIAKVRRVEVPDTESQRVWVSTFQAAVLNWTARAHRG
jgi:protein-tyrosine phosphatase